MPTPIMLRPAAAWEEAVLLPAPAGTWTALRGPLLVALFFGCGISLMDGGRLTLRLVAPATFWWTFVPAVEILALFAVSGAARRSAWRRTIDLFFMGHGPWLLWIIAFSSYWAFLPTATAFSWAFRNRFWNDSAYLVAIWSAYIDFWFFRRVLKCTAWQAGRDLMLQRLLSWTAGLAIFLFSAGSQVVASRLGL